jgi:PKD repeat protein
MKRNSLRILGLLALVLLIGGSASVQFTSSDELPPMRSEREYPLMRPDPATWDLWQAETLAAPRAKIDPQIGRELELARARGIATSMDLLAHIDYVTADRNQGRCGNCWVWGGMGVAEIAHDVENGVLDRHSIQYLNSCRADWACCGGTLSDFATWYSGQGFMIPWSNTSAGFADGGRRCADGWSLVPCGQISTTPYYSLSTISAETIETHDGQGNAIANIKNVLNQNRGVYFGFALPDDAAWDNFFDFWDGVGGENETTLWNDADAFCGQDWDDDEGGGHGVVILGYNDDDVNPANHYWLALNSWGDAGGVRPNGLFRVPTHLDYDCDYRRLGRDRDAFSFQTLNIDFSNAPPLADVGGPYSEDEGAPIALDGSGSSDPEGHDLTYNWTFGDGGTGTGETPSHSYDDDGLYTVCLTVADPYGESDTDCTTADIANVPPTATFNYPTEVDEGSSFALSLADPYDPSPIDTAAGFEYDFDCGDGYDGWSTDTTAACQTYDDGILDVAAKIRDKDGGVTIYETEVTVVNLPPFVTADVDSQAIQYSDHICTVTFQAGDVADDPLTASTSYCVDGSCWSGLPASLALTSQGCVLTGYGIRHICTWTLDGTIDVPEGEYVITVTVDDGDGGQAPADTTVIVGPEDADIWLEENNPVAVQVETDGGVSPEFTLEAYIQETYPDNAACGPDAGDIDDARVSMSLVPVGPGSTHTVLCTNAGVSGSGYDAILTVECDFDDIPVNVYHVQATAVGGYYTSAMVEDVLVIFDPSLGFTTGGGWFYWPGTTQKTSFGYTMKYNKALTHVKGNLLLIRHMEDGSIYRLKSNALFGLSIGDFEEDGMTVGWASFAGKCTYIEPGWEEPEGNHRFTVYVEDWNEPGDMDQFWLEVRDGQGNVIPVMSMDLPATENTVTLGGGNIVVPHNPD